MKLQSARNFVNCSDQIALVNKYLDQIKRGPIVKDCLINYFGVPGIGKSALLAKLYELHRNEPKFITIAIDLETFPSDLTMAKIVFAQAIADDIQRVINSNTEFLQELESLNESSDDSKIDQALDTIVTILCNIKKPLILLIDSWERAPEAMLAWVEHKLLLPLVRSQCLFCIACSQMVLRWRQFEVRRCVQVHELSPLDAEATRLQVGCTDDLKNSVLDITAGLPFANEIVFGYLAHEPISTTWLTEHRAQLARIISAEIQQRVVAGMSVEIARVFRVMSVFREFDITTLQTILPIFLDDFGNSSQSALLLLVKQMVVTRLVSWNEFLRAYQIDPTIRKIFAHALEWEEADQHQAIREAALKYYQDMIREVPNNRHIYIREYFYHLLYRADVNGYNGQELQAEFEQLIRRYYISPDASYIDTQSLGQLHELLGKDHELQQALGANYLSPTLFLQGLDTIIGTI